jgi:hypothetical protein
MGIAIPILSYLGQALILLALQVLFFKQIPLFDYAFCFVYPGIILFLPTHINRLLLLFLGVLTGLIVDLFYGTLGIHALASLFLAYFRGLTIDGLENKKNDNKHQVELEKPWVAYKGMKWMFVYLFITLTIHHLVLFFVDAGGVETFFETFAMVFGSVLYSFLVLISIQLIFYKRKA